MIRVKSGRALPELVRGSWFVVLIIVLGACALNNRPSLTPAEMSGLWAEPEDLNRRDLFSGPAAGRYAPDANGKFEFEEMKETGYNPGFDVKDAAGREWSVKIGNESRVEVTISRILWGIGYHQPYNFYVPRWTMTRDGRDTVLTSEGSRFRLELKDEDKKGEWSWRRNPFLETQPMAGLAVFMVMINNWDIKTEQNAIYEIAHDGGDPEIRYMVRDVGAALGKSGWLMSGTKDKPDDFEREPFIQRVEGNRVYFHYKGATMEPHFLEGVTPADVRWISGLLARLTDKQWSDAFRAGGFTEPEAARHIRRLREKVEEGLRAGLR